jgi:hypothetical protein
MSGCLSPHIRKEKRYRAKVQPGLSLYVRRKLVHIKKPVKAKNRPGGLKQGAELRSDLAAIFGECWSTWLPADARFPSGVQVESTGGLCIRSRVKSTVFCLTDLTSVPSRPLGFDQ